MTDKQRKGQKLLNYLRFCENLEEPRQDDERPYPIFSKLFNMPDDEFEFISNLSDEQFYCIMEKKYRND